MPEKMSDAPNDKLQEPGSSRALSNPIVRFLLGALLGILFPLVYLSYVWYFGSSVTATQLWFLGSIAMGCGICGAVAGERVFPYLVSLIENLPSI